MNTGIKRHSNYRDIFILCQLFVSPLYGKPTPAVVSFFFLFFTPHHYHQKVAGEKLIGARHVRYDHRLFATASLSFEENWLM